MRISDWSSDVCSSDLNLPESSDLQPQPSQSKSAETPNLQVQVIGPSDNAGPSSNAGASDQPSGTTGPVFGTGSQSDPAAQAAPDRKSVGEGKGVPVRVDPGGPLIIKNKKEEKT